MESYNDRLLDEAARDVMGDENELWCAVCQAFDATYCVYEGRPLCDKCAMCWTSEPKENDDENQ